MNRALAFPALILLLAPALGGCHKVQARVELKKGNTFYQQESYSKALGQFQKGLELDPGATFAWRSVGLTALAMYRPGDDAPENVKVGETAVTAFENYLADYPDDEKVQEYLMTMYVNSKKYDDAIAYIDKKIAEDPVANANLQRYKITIMTQAGRIDQAWQLAQRHQGPDRAEVLYTVGVSAWDKAYHDPTFDSATREKLVDTGLTALEQAIKVKPDYHEAMSYYNLLFREKAKLAIDANKRMEYIALADEWAKKSMEARKKAAAAQPAES